VTEDPRAHGRVFDEVAAEYDEFRRGYPAELVDVAMERGGLAAGSRVLEVGCGTGKLTERLVGRGLRIDAVDPGAAMLDMARRRLGSSDDVTFHLAPFEEVELPADTFDALFSATAFHWVDPNVGWAKAARLLRSGGLLALLAHTVVRTERSADADEEFQALVRMHAPEVAADWQPMRDLETLEAGLDERRGNISTLWDWGSHGRFDLAVDEAARLFEDVEPTVVVTDIEETGDEFLALFRTTSMYRRIPPERRGAFDDDVRRLFDRHGGALRASLATVLATALRAG
jgi:SAM-dependent methyltransferase